MKPFWQRASVKRLREEARAIGRFASRTLHDYETTASVLPSSRFLTRAMLAPLDFSSARAIVELGPGTGALTRQILERMSPQATLYAIELDEVLAKGLASEVRDPRLQVIHGSAVDVRALLSARGVTTVDAVISSLGLSLFPEDLRQAVLHAAVDVLRPDGVLTLDAALGDAQQLTRPLLRVRVAAPVADETAARALGARAVAELHAAGAAGYLAAA